MISTLIEFALLTLIIGLLIFGIGICVALFTNALDYVVSTILFCVIPLAIGGTMVLNAIAVYAMLLVLT